MKRFARYRFLILGFLILLATSFMPADDYTIIIKRKLAETNGNDCSFYTITGSRNNIKINYLRIDSVYYRNAEYEKNRKRHEKDTTDAGLFARYRSNDSLIKIHSRHIEKNVEVKRSKQPLYFKQVDSVLNSGSDILLYRAQGYKFLMDGVTYEFDIRTNGQRRTFHISNPDVYFAAPLYRVITTTVTFLDVKEN